MKTLIVTTDGLIEKAEVPMPAYGPKQALVKTVACGICNGTDAKLIHRKFKGVPLSEYPLMLGHEGVGKVVETGAECVSLKKGDYVLLPFVDTDPAVYGSLKSYWGAYSEYAVVNDLAAYEPGTAPEAAYAQTVVPEGVDPVDASMIVTLREVLSSIRRFGITAGKSIAVFGCGPVGLTFIRFLKLLGVSPIIAFDIVEEKCADALKNGADYAFNSGRVDPVAKVREICPEGVPYVLDAVGVTSLVNLAMRLISDQGKICVYGISPENDMEIDWSQAPYNWQLHFQQFPSKAEEGVVNDEINELILSGKICLKDYISDYFDFDNFEEAFAKLEKREIAKKGIIVYPD